MKRPFYQLILLALAALFSTGGTFTCESNTNDKPRDDHHNPR